MYHDRCKTPPIYEEPFNTLPTLIILCLMNPPIRLGLLDQQREALQNDFLWNTLSYPNRESRKMKQHTWQKITVNVYRTRRWRTVWANTIHVYISIDTKLCSMSLYLFLLNKTVLMIANDLEPNCFRPSFIITISIPWNDLLFWGPNWYVHRLNNVGLMIQSLWHQAINTIFTVLWHYTSLLVFKYHWCQSKNSQLIQILLQNDYISIHWLQIQKKQNTIMKILECHEVIWTETFQTERVQLSSSFRINII